MKLFSHELERSCIGIALNQSKSTVYKLQHINYSIVLSIIIEYRSQTVQHQVRKWMLKCERDDFVHSAYIKSAVEAE